MGFLSVIRNISKRGFKDILNPKRVANYLDGEVIKAEGLHLEVSQVIPYSVELANRFKFSECRKCVEQGHCSHCGCEQPISIITPDWECGGGNFMAMDLQTKEEKRK